MTEEFEIPPYLRKPANGTRLATESMISCIDFKIAKLAKLGLRLHPNMLGYRRELDDQLIAGGPYKLHTFSGVF